MRLINADKLMNVYADRLVKVSGRYGIDSAEAGILSGAMKLLEVQPTVRCVEDALDMAIEVLQEQKWIPCSERLPGKGEYVLITNHWHEVRTAYLTDSTRGKVLCWIVDHNSYHPVDRNEILAWMPLPIGYEVKDD